jgi:hypothetical protein
VSGNFQRFLDERLPLPGVVAAAIRLPDHSILCRRDGDAMTKLQVEQTLARIALAIEGLKRHRFDLKGLCWTFDQAHIHLTPRLDGALLAVIAEHTQGEPLNPRVLQLAQSFLDLPAD